MESTDGLERIFSHPLLRDVSAATLEEIRRSLVRRTVRAGCEIFTRCKPPAGWYGIIDGEVSIASSSAGGDRVVFAILKAGDWFGEVALVADRPDSVDAIARRDCELAFVPAVCFRRLLSREPQLPARMMAELAQRVQALADMITDLAMLPMACRLAKRVMAMSDGPLVEHERVSQEEYGLLVAARRQTVNRELRKWERAGWIHIEYGGIRVLNRGALERLVETTSGY